jgi:uncharacterized membrane protein YkvA (DUF1232 family)
MTSKPDDPAATSFYSSLQTRVDGWLASPEGGAFPHAQLYRHLPELYRLLVELALDVRVPEHERTCTMAVVKYIIAPYDLIPEALVGTSGFRDDLVLAALMVDRLAQACGPEPIVEHWSTAGDPRSIARAIIDSATAMIGSDICERLRAWLPP